MAGKTKSQKKKALDMRSKMYLVLALCSVMLLVSVGISLVLIGGIDLGGADAQSVSTVDSASMVVESGYNKEENTIDTQAYTSTILEQAADAGDSYVDETLFLGDSNTARMYRMFDYCSYDNAIGSVGMTAKSLATFACVQVSTSSGYITMPQAVAKLQPRRVILTFGTNDLNPGYKAADFVKNYQTGIEAIVTAYPSVDVIVNAIPPIGQQHSNQSLTQTQVDEYNKALVEMCQEKGWKFLNSAEVLKDSVTGYAKSGYVETSDGIHLTRTAMDALFNYIRTHSYITEDDRPALTTIPKHTGDKDAVVYTVPVVVPAETATPEPEATEEPADSESTSDSYVETTPTPTPEVTATPSPTPAPTMAVYDEVSFDDWRDGADCTMPDYTFSAPHKPQPQEQVTWPTDGVTLCYNAKTLEEAAEIFHTTVENLKELNPDWQDKYSRAIGCYWALKVQAEPYTLPMNNVVTVTVNAPWVESYYDRTEVCDVPASLDKQARAVLASAYYFQYHWWGMHAGFMPYEKLAEPVGFFNYRAADGAFYTRFSEFGSFLHTVYSDAWVDDMLSMDPAPFAEGENDTILTLDGDCGGNIAYCGHLFTEPELQPDGSLAFWQLSLTCESDDFKGWAGEETIVPDTATVTTVRLVPTENGWRVDALELPS